MLHAGLVVSLLKMPMDWHSSKQRSCARLFRNDHRCRGVLCAEEVRDFLFSNRWTSFEAFLADGLFRLTTTPFEEEAVIARLFYPAAGGPGWGGFRSGDGDGVRSPHKKANKPKATSVPRPPPRPPRGSCPRLRPRLRPRLVLVFRSALCAPSCPCLPLGRSNG